VKTLDRQSPINNLNYWVWDGTDNRGKNVPAGAYFCIIEAARQKVAKKVVRLK